MGVEPVVKWPGGKRWVAPLIGKLVGSSLRRTYVEPFLGGGAVFFHIAHPQSVLSDINADLVEAFDTLRRDPEAVAKALSRLSNTASCYYAVRASLPRSSASRAARFIYLTKTCWGGIYRLNRNGEFNVPFGNSGRVFWRRGEVFAAAQALQAATLRVADFESVIASAGAGDVIYADPPYTTLGENNGFLRYNERLFAFGDQIRLAETCWKAHRRGVAVIISGLFHSSVLSLYKGWWAIRVARHSTVSRLASGRRTVTEVLITNRLPPLESVPHETIERIAS